MFVVLQGDPVPCQRCAGTGNLSHFLIFSIDHIVIDVYYMAWVWFWCEMWDKILLALWFWRYILMIGLCNMCSLGEQISCCIVNYPEVTLMKIFPNLNKCLLTVIGNWIGFYKLEFCCMMESGARYIHDQEHVLSLFLLFAIEQSYFVCGYGVLCGTCFLWKLL